MNKNTRRSERASTKKGKKERRNVKVFSYDSQAGHVLSVIDAIQGKAVLFNLEGLETGDTGHVAIGNNVKRRRYSLELQEYTTVIHPGAIISPTAVIEDGVFVGAGAYVGPRAHIGRGSIINTGTVVEHESIIGDFCHLAPKSVVCGNCIVGELSFLGAGAILTPGQYLECETIFKAGTVNGRYKKS